MICLAVHAGNRQANLSWQLMESKGVCLTTNLQFKRDQLLVIWRHFISAALLQSSSYIPNIFFPSVVEKQVLSSAERTFLLFSKKKECAMGGMRVYSQSDEDCDSSDGIRSVKWDCDISVDEEDLILRLHKLLGERWELIAARLPWRTPQEIQKYWKLKSDARVGYKAKISSKAMQ